MEILRKIAVNRTLCELHAIHERIERIIEDINTKLDGLKAEYIYLKSNFSDHRVTPLLDNLTKEAKRLQDKGEDLTATSIFVLSVAWHLNEIEENYAAHHD